MKLYCPHCGVRGAAADSYRGKTVKCPKCQGTFVAAEPIAPGGAEPPAAAGEERIPAESLENLREQETLTEPLTPVEQVSPAEGLPADEAIEAEAVEVTAEQQEFMTPSPEDARPEEEQEAVRNWHEMADGSEAKTATDDFRQAGEKEELPDGLDSETVEKRQAGPEAVEAVDQQIAAPHEYAGAGTDDRLPDREERSDKNAGTKDRRDAEMAEEDRDPFIFADRVAGSDPEVEDQPYGMIEEQCWQCGKKNLSGASFAASGGRLYCPECAPAAEPLPPCAGRGPGGPPPSAETGEAGPADVAEGSLRFTIGGALREAWKKTRGAKGPILAGSAVMYLTLLLLGAAAGFLLPMFGHDLTAPETGTTAQIINFLFKALINAVYVLFTAGLAYMGIRKVAGDPISWRMVCTGFSDSGKVLVATILKFVLIFIGFLILVLPGIYLAIGYSMTIPLIVDRKMSPWQAMETSRKAVHRVWWRVFGLYLVMGLLFAVSMVPLGIGLIWTWPMLFILAGVVYRTLFGVNK